MKKEIKFIGVDSFGRPIFKQLDAMLYYGSTCRLFPSDAEESEVLKTVSESDLSYFGNSFGCEPMGTSAGNIKIWYQLKIGQKIKNKETGEVDKIVDVAMTKASINTPLVIYILKNRRRVCSESLHKQWEVYS